MIGNPMTGVGIYDPTAQPGADDTLPCAPMRACVVLLPTYNAWDVLSWEGVSCGSPGICTIVGINYT